MFYWEPGIALHAIQGNQASSLTEGEVSLLFSCCGGTWVIFSSYGRCGHSKLVSVKRGQESCLVTMDTSGIKTRLGRRIQTLLEVRLETEGHFLIGTVIFGYLTIFKKCQASSTFEALYSASLSMCQRDVRPIVQMRWRPSAFSRVSTGDSGIL